MRGAEAGVIDILPIGIMIASLIAMPFGIGMYVKGIQSRKVVMKQKRIQEYLLNLYQFAEEKR